MHEKNIAPKTTKTVTTTVAARVAAEVSPSPTVVTVVVAKWNAVVYTRLSRSRTINRSRQRLLPVPELVQVQVRVGPVPVHRYDLQVPAEIPRV